MDDQATILVVDDSEMNRDVLEGLIEALGHTALLANNGKEALELIARTPSIDLILLDIIMPEMGGYEVLQHIQNDKELRHIPTIMISVVDEMDTVVKCIEAGAEDYLTKPFNSILLKAKINSCLARKRQHDQESKFTLWLAESYQKLQKAEESRDSLFHMIIHDMNNPLTVVRATLDIIKYSPQKYQVSSDIASLLDKVDIASQQINTLIKCIMDVAAMEQGNIPVSKAAADAVEIAHSMVQQFEEEVSKKNGRLSFHSPVPTIPCHVDESLLRRILQNLLANSVKYGMSSPDPEITLSVAQKNNSIQFSVRDNGPGIPNENLDHIFTKFFRLNDTEKGLGLGLTFCKMAAEGLEGSLRVENNADRGCTFYLTLPLE